MPPLGGVNSFPGGRIGSETNLAGGFSEPPIGIGIGVGIACGGVDLGVVALPPGGCELVCEPPTGVETGAPVSCVVPLEPLLGGVCVVSDTTFTGGGFGMCSHGGPPPTGNGGIGGNHGGNLPFHHGGGFHPGGGTIGRIIGGTGVLVSCVVPLEVPLGGLLRIFSDAPLVSLGGVCTVSETTFTGCDWFGNTPIGVGISWGGLDLDDEVPPVPGEPV